MKTTKCLLAIATVLELTGCSHAIMRGSVAMKINENEAHVCLGKGEVRAGDRVMLFRNACVPDGGRLGGAAGYCEMVKLGGGTVERTLNEHYSIVKFDSGIQFEDGSFVEKM